MENLYNRVDKLDEQIPSVKLPYMAWKVLFLVDKKSESNKIASILEADIEDVNSSLALLVENNLITQTASSAPETVEAKEKVIPAEPELVEEKEPQKEEVAEEKIEEIPVEEDIVLEPISEDDASAEGDDIEIKISEEEDVESSDDMEFNFDLAPEEGVEAKKEEEPKTGPEPPKEESKPTEKSTEGGKKILVIDDSLVIRKMVEIALEDEDYNISTAVSGKEGLDSLDKINPDLVILDMMLPDINGIEILKTIKASKGIPVIMLSGKDSPQMIESAKTEGAEEFLPKPFKDDDLVEKIKNLL